jgi:hypothetical protein
MKTIIAFKMTLIGGLLVVLAFWVNLLLSFEAIKGALALLQPIAKLVPQKIVHHDAVALCLLVLICFVVGLVIRTELGKRIGDWFEQHLLGKIPSFPLIRGMIRQFARGKDEQSFQPALVGIEEALVRAFVIEKHAYGPIHGIYFFQSHTHGRRNLHSSTATRAPGGRAVAQSDGVCDKVGAGRAEMRAAIRRKKRE